MPLVTKNKYIASGVGILTHLIINNLEWKEDVDLRDNWKLRKPKPILKVKSKEPVTTVNSGTSAANIQWDSTITTNSVANGRYIWTSVEATVF